ncbi:MAG: hypothetical protein LUD81_01480 [Clostridiales bacterium]|nr:hypothetical protein [Clostridiales bacterium]
MIKIEETVVYGFPEAICGMRNPMNSWDKSDTACIDGDDSNVMEVGENDYNLMMKLSAAGPVHGKFKRMITVYTDITAPLYWWKEYDTYKVGTVANSCSTMHKIHEKEFTVEDFSREHLSGMTTGLWTNADGTVYYTSPCDFLQIICNVLNNYRDKFIKTQNKDYWWQMIQLLPSSYNQKRTVMLNYEVLTNIYIYRKDHKLDEWKDFCKWIEDLPLSELITGKDETNEQ